jgi:hypothetical protein
METPVRNQERFFCIELKSKTHLKIIAMASGSSEGVLIEGMLGELQCVRFAEGLVLELVGSYGIIRIDIGADEIKKVQVKNEKGGEAKQ